MATLDYFRSAMQDLHRNLWEAIKDLNKEQLHFRPLEKGNHIAFMIWHAVRTEDSVVNFVLQKKAPVWNAEGWDKKFGMDPRAQGTGMTAEQAATVRINDLAEFLKYTEKVFQASEVYLNGLKEEDLDSVGDFPYFGKRSVGQVIGGVIIQHNAEHLGEIWYVKGLQGMKGSPI